MSDVTNDLDHVKEAEDLLIFQFRDKVVVKGILDTLIRRVQDAENGLYSVWFYHLLKNSVGDQLDQWGKVLDLGREGRPDNEYQVALQIRMRAMRSHGKPGDLIDIAQLALTLSPTGTLKYFERVGGPGWTLQADNIPAWVVLALQEGLEAGRPSTIQGEFVYSEWPLSQGLQWQHTASVATITGVWAWTGTTVTSYWAGIATI